MIFDLTERKTIEISCTIVAEIFLNLVFKDWLKKKFAWFTLIIII